MMMLDNTIRERERERESSLRWDSRCVGCTQVKIMAWKEAHEDEVGVGVRSSSFMSPAIFEEGRKLSFKAMAMRCTIR